MPTSIALDICNYFYHNYISQLIQLVTIGDQDGMFSVTVSYATYKTSCWYSNQLLWDKSI